MMKRILFFVLVLFISDKLWCQQANISSDTTSYLIGDHIQLTLSIVPDKQQGFLFPDLQDTIFPHFEILNKTSVDTINHADKIELLQRINLICFDSGAFLLPPIPIYDPNGNLLTQTNELLLTINTLPLDSALEIKDIKNVLKEPITFKEILPYLLIGLGVLALLAAIVVLIVKLVNRKKTPITNVRPKPTEPAHVVALRNLDILWQKRLWENGLTKQYYSELSDICRLYIYHRWDIGAMEMVTAEIIESLEKERLNKTTIDLLQKVFVQADMVKFAKANPFPNEIAFNHQTVVAFVEETKVINPIKEEK